MLSAVTFQLCTLFKKVKVCNQPTMLSLMMLSSGTASSPKQTSGGLEARFEQLTSELEDMKMMLDAERMMTVRQPLEAHKSPLL